MKTLLLSVFTALLFTACADNDTGDDAELKDPLETQPVSDAIPDSMRLTDDSTIVPDVRPGSGNAPDSASRNRK